MLLLLLLLLQLSSSGVGKDVLDAKVGDVAKAVEQGDPRRHVQEANEHDDGYKQFRLVHFHAVMILLVNFFKNRI